MNPRRRLARFLIRITARLLAPDVVTAEAEALRHIEVSARLAGWSEPAAAECARLLRARSVTPATAARVFCVVPDWVQ